MPPRRNPLLALVIGTPGLSAAVMRSFIDSGAPDLLAYLREMNDPDGADGLAILSRKVSGVEGMTLAASEHCPREGMPVSVPV
jgi:hypothetical protein